MHHPILLQLYRSLYSCDRRFQWSNVPPENKKAATEKLLKLDSEIQLLDSSILCNSCTGNTVATRVSDGTASLNQIRNDLIEQDKDLN